METATTTLVFEERKTPRERDTVTILRGKRTWVFKAWGRGLLPHELVHYGVEAVYGLRGFVRLTVDGLSTDEILEGGVDTEALHAEYLTSAHQYVLTGQSEPTHAAFRDLLERLRCDAPPVEVGDEQIERARVLLAALTLSWGALGLGRTPKRTLRP
jgi:hypothetical protein